MLKRSKKDKNKTRLLRIAILIETSRAWGRQLLRGITRYARLHGLWSFYQPPPFYLRPSRNKTSMLIDGLNPDGIFLGGDIHLKSMLKKGIPSVIVDVKENIGDMPDNNLDSPAILGDNQTIGKMAAEYFMNLGLKHFAFCGFDICEWSCQRGQAYEDTLRKSGQSVMFYESSISMSLPKWRKEKTLLTQWLSSLPKPVGIFACNDDCGQFVIDTCRDARLKVPDEIAVLGVDNDIMICELTDPPLSSIALNAEKTGYEAAAMLDKMMRGQPLKNKLIITTASHIVSRQSTEIPAIDDPYVLQAIRYIHRNAALPIQIDDVAAAAAMSRRSLTDRFRAALNRSVHEEICRVRADRISQMLLETDIPVLQIAVDMGFTSPEHISRFFKKEKGITPNEFRKRYKKPSPE